jgi:molybdopterin converting factor small subunit
MARVTVKDPSQLRGATNGVGEISVPGSTVGAALAAIRGVYPELIERIGEPDRNAYRFKLRRFVNIYVDGEDIDFQMGLETALEGGEEVTILPANAGG